MERAHAQPFALSPSTPPPSAAALRAGCGAKPRSRRANGYAAVVAGVLVTALACTRASKDPQLEAEWKAWHERREERLRAPDGWLALVGLHWLKDGENRVEGLPGVFTASGDGVTLRATPEDGYTLEGQPVTERRLAADSAEEPDRLRIGSRTVQVIDRGGKLALRVWDAESPVRKGFHGIDTFPVDPRWRIEARWEAYPVARDVVTPSVAGPPQRGEAPGLARFTIDGRALALEPTLEGDSLFFVFKDETARKETYGAGRFLAAEAPRDGKVVLDFNRAYNPPCAFTPYATCPLPRPENVLAVRIEAGEKRFGDH
jgi:uncharacterized protein